MKSTRVYWLVLICILLALLTGCEPFGAQPTPTPLPTYTPAPTYTPLPTFTPLPTNTPLPTDTPTPPPTYTPYPTYTPVPTATPEPTEEPTEVPPTRPPATRAPATAVPPPTAPPDPCAGIPADASGSISPKCGNTNTRFTMNIWGFAANEQVGFWLDGEHGVIAGTRDTVSIGPTGGVEGLWFYPYQFDLIPGLYFWVFQGVSSGHQSILYFKVIP